MSQPRIPAQPSENWGPDVLDALAVLRPPGAPVQTAAERAAAPRPNSAILGTFSWHPELAKAWFLFNSRIFNATISARIREMATVRIAWLRRGEYEIGPSACGWPRASECPTPRSTRSPKAPTRRCGAASIRRCCARSTSSARTATSTTSSGPGLFPTQLDRQQLMDFVFTVGAYDLLCMATNNFGLGLDPGLEGFPAEAKSD